MKTLIFKLLIGLIIFVLWSSLTLLAQEIDSLVSSSLQFAEQQLTNTVKEVGSASKFPRSTVSDGSWKTKDSGSWTSGFFPGCLWYMYEKTSDNTWKTWAQNWTNGMESEKFDTGTHDVGFKIFCSFGNGYRITSNEAYRNVILQAASSLATRYNPTVGCIKSWNSGSRGQYPVIIDNMMNLELLFWASKQPGGKQEWYDMALSHALKTIENHVRSDGSTYHVVDYDPNTGKVIKQNTVQGYSDESAWARGQAWGLYGFTMTYRETNDNRFLETAMDLADYYIYYLPEDRVPYWDFQAPNIPNEEKDASSAAIAASGLLELSTLVNDSYEEEKYRNAAVDILTSLCSPAYLAKGTKSSGILLHGVGNRNSNSEVDVSLIYADYYFIEALMRYGPMITSVLADNDQNRLIPNSIQLFQNYPNPFNSKTIIEYFLASPNNVSLRVYDLNGCLIETPCEGFQEMGEHRFCFDGEFLPSGSYFLLLKAGSQIRKKKMLLVR